LASRLYFSQFLPLIPPSKINREDCLFLWDSFFIDIIFGYYNRVMEKDKGK